MRHDVLMMDNAVDGLDLVVEVLGEVGIADPWPSVMVHLHLQVREGAFQFQGCDLSQSAAQAVPGCNQCSRGMLAENGLDLAGNLGCDCEVIGVEAAVDLAAQTVDVRYLLEVEVFDPVLDV